MYILGIPLNTLETAVGCGQGESGWRVWWAVRGSFVGSPRWPTQQSRLVRLNPGSRPPLIDSSTGSIVSSTDFYRSRTELVVNRTNNDCWARALAVGLL